MPKLQVVREACLNKLHYRLLSVDDRVYAKREELPNARNLSCAASLGSVADEQEFQATITVKHALIDA